jgi:tRNA(adenine34) deaminase
MDFMRAALSMANKGSEEGEVPVGAIIVQAGTPIASAHNLVERYKNPILHAEILAISEACKLTGSKYLRDCDLYVTLEPCAMCAAAISFARIGRLFYGARDFKRGAIEGNLSFFNRAEEPYVRPYEVYESLLEKETGQVISEFFKGLRKA